MTEVLSENLEAQEAWDGPLFDRFVEFREVIVGGLSKHGDAALRIAPPQPGARVLDVGCGFGDTSQQIAGLVGPEGSVLGVDVAPRFIEAAREEAAAAGVQNVEFEVVDVQAHQFEQEFDYAFSRFGTMFFANPVPALRNVRGALVPGGRLCSVVWRKREDNPWLYAAEVIVKDLMGEAPEDSEEPRCGPGPFSMAGPDTTSEILMAAGFEDIAFHRVDISYVFGRDLDEAVRLVMSLGPGAEVIRLSGEAADEVRPKVESALHEGLASYVTDDGSLVGNSSTWTITARVPGAV
jgi:ubiquinone/menaquinone biosynthesis C-methylase UbiE